MKGREDDPAGHRRRYTGRFLASSLRYSCPVSKIAPKHYGDKLNVRQEVTGPGGGPLQIDVLLSTHVLTPENLPKLTEAELDTWQVAISTVHKLLAPTPPTIDGEFTEAEKEKPK